jgi:hypothetical protein
VSNNLYFKEIKYYGEDSEKDNIIEGIIFCRNNKIFEILKQRKESFNVS